MDTDHIRTAETVYTAPPGYAPADWAAIPPAERCMRRDPGAMRVPPPKSNAVRVGSRVYARLNHGRWLVECLSCPSAQITSPDDPRFYCIECGNAGTGMWFAVVWPDADVRKAIESDARDLTGRERNWAHNADTTPAARATRGATRIRR